MNLRRLSWMLVALQLSGCGARYVRFQEKGMTCTQAQGLAIRAVQKMGYGIDESVKPLPGFPGIIRASRAALVEGDKQKLFVQVFCTSMGAEIEAKSEDGGVGQISFASDFRSAFDKVVSTIPPARVAAAQGLDVVVMPQSGAGTTEFPVDLSQRGIFPVLVRVTNNTTRTYQLKSKDVVLQTTSGEKVKSSPVDGVAQGLDPSAAAHVKERHLASGLVAPQATVTGLLYFPLQPYSRARVTLTDQADGEPEGFSIEF